MITGMVSLIGAGPGDPGLITVRGLERLKRADVVVYDRLAHPALLDFARQDAEKIYVGKASAQHAMKQPDINALLVEKALAGKSVARLKGGDPLVFGRGGEEAEFCRENGVHFEFVPGVTSAIAAPAYAGIPVTHRDAASSFAVVTGHERDDSRESGTRAPGEAEQRRNWATLAHAADTLIFLMGVEALPEITARLQENGRSGGTPVALVQWGTWTRQRVVTGTLATIVDEVKAAGLTPPAVCVVGEVVKLRESLRWFDSPEARPLLGKSVVVTRAREQASALTDLLREAGAEPVEFPTISIKPLDSVAELDWRLDVLGSYQWIVFTSANAVSAVAERMKALHMDARSFSTSVKIAAIGPATAEAVWEQFRLRADYVPGDAVGEAALAQWPDQEMEGKKVLLPRAKEARDVLPDGLRERGATVDVVAVYQTTMDDSGAKAMRERLQNGEIDVLTFTSSSTARNFVTALVGSDTGALSSLLGSVTVAAIGPVTAQTCRELGLEPRLIAGEHTIPGLVSALESHFRREARNETPEQDMTLLFHADTLEGRNIA